VKGLNVKNKILIYVGGGIIQEVRASDVNIDVEIIDADNLEAEGLTNDQIEEMWDIRKKGLTTVY
jgi:hypothetical protein